MSVFNFYIRMTSQARTAFWFVLGFSLLRLVIVGRFGLSGDEAHYALYGYFLDWSYFDHPPLVGWLQALVLTFGDSFFVLRLWPVLLSALGAYLLYTLSRKLFSQGSPWLPFAAVVVWQSALIAHLLGMAMLPDTPLLVAGLLAALFLHRVFIEGEPKAWLGVGFCFGLAGLSKYTAAMLVVTALLLMFEYRRWRDLRSIWLWGGVVVALLMIMPVLWWNYTHDWISFAYQIGHGMPERHWSVQRAVLSVTGQLLSYGPLLVIPGFIALFTGWRRKEQRFLLLLVVPLLLPFFWSSGYEATLPHWTALGWLLLSPLVAAWWLEQWHRVAAIRHLGRIALGYSISLLLIVYSELFYSWIPFHEKQYPLADLHGWEEVSIRAAELAGEMSPAEPKLFTGNWSFASHIGWHVRPLPVMVADTNYTQSDIWYGSPKTGDNGVLVVPQQFRGETAGNGIRVFESCDFVETVEIVLRDKVATEFDLYRCSGFQL